MSQKSVRRDRSIRALRVLVAMSLLMAISIVCGKYLAIRGGEVLRFSFENLPILMTGMLFGPAAGAIVGVVADLIGCVLVGYPVNLVVTLGAAAVGVFAGLVWRLAAKAPYYLRVALAVFFAHFLGSVLIKTVGLSAFYDMSLWLLMLWRTINYLIIGGIEGVLLAIIMKNKSFIKAAGGK